MSNSVVQNQLSIDVMNITPIDENKDESSKDEPQKNEQFSFDDNVFGHKPLVSEGKSHDTP